MTKLRIHKDLPDGRYLFSAYRERVIVQVVNGSVKPLRSLTDGFSLAHYDDGDYDIYRWVGYFAQKYDVKHYYESI